MMASETSAVNSNNLVIPVLFPSPPFLQAHSLTSPARRLLPIPLWHTPATPSNRPIHSPRLQNSRLHLPNQPPHSPPNTFKNLPSLLLLLRAPSSRKRRPRLDNPRIKPRLRLPWARKSLNPHQQRRSRSFTLTSPRFEGEHRNWSRRRRGNTE